MIHVAFAIVNKHGRIAELWERKPSQQIARNWDEKHAPRGAPHRVVNLYADDADKVKLWTPTVEEATQHHG